MSNTSYRIKYDFNNKTDHIKVKLNRSVDMFEVLSLKMTQEDSYKLYNSNYGVLIGRIIANDGFGIQNAKVSIFIPTKSIDLSDEKSLIYPYTSTSSLNNQNIRYNLLPSEKQGNCYQNVGTFPSKRKLLDNNVLIEVFDEYYKFTTTTNSSGDYMIFGIPVGQHQMHVDIDLSDIGALSQSPRDLEYKGYDIKQFENANKFKKSTNLDSLSQIITENSDVYIYPFWGDDSNEDVAISKKDINIRYKFEPTCVFIGSIFTDSYKNAISKSCKPSKNSGKMGELITGQGSIEMIRLTQDDRIESFEVSGNRLIDDNGVWCYQIPMNLDYVITDEYGNIKPTNNVNIGIPTRASVRFRVTIDGSNNNFSQTRTAAYLVPNNPISEDDEDYEFGTNTKRNSFVNLMWNKVYSVKSYIPRIQKGSIFDWFISKNRRFNGIKSTNNHGTNNPTPYNTIWVNINLRFSLTCLLTKMFIQTVRMVNDAFNWIDQKINIEIAQIGIETSLIGDCDSVSEITSRQLYIPNSKGVWSGLISKTRNHYKNNTLAYEGTDSIYGSNFYFDKIIDCIETTLSQENDVINFDFTNDWINGTLYAPRFFIKTKKNKRNGTPKSIYCGSYNINEYPNLLLVQSCAVNTSNSGHSDNDTVIKCTNEKKCYKKTSQVSLTKGNVMPNISDIAYYRSNEIDDGIIKYIQPTEVILIGSLIDNDYDGIPQLHQLLPPTTFKLPPDVVDEESSGFFSGVTYYNLTGYNYTFIDQYLTFRELSGTTGNIDSIYYVLDDGTGLEAYYGWDSLYYEIPYDDIKNPTYDYGRFSTQTGTTWVETGMTVEMSGVDWGNTDNTTNGLFLGITCSDSFTTIKSCINSNRICEIGVDLDERHVYDIGNFEITNEVDGYISNEEIVDGDSRSMFATLNYKKLTTKSINGTLKYDFNYIYADGFDGRLHSVKPDEYNNIDYYKFRFGERYQSNNESYYSYNKNEYSFPKYENSFYFYFGLKPGKTAIDVFNSKYYALCNGSDNDKFVVTLSNTQKETISGFDGIILINVSDIVIPYSIYIDDVLYQKNITSFQTEISGLISKIYNIKIIDAYEDVVSKNVIVNHE